MKSVSMGDAQRERKALRYLGSSDGVYVDVEESCESCGSQGLEEIVSSDNFAYSCDSKPPD